MTKQSVANNREKTLGENILVVVLVASLMSAFLYYFFKHQQTISQAGFQIAATNFASKITAIRAQWFMENQPLSLMVKEKDGSKSAIPLNKKGWVDFAQDGVSCRKIWRVIMVDDLTFINQPVAVMSVSDEVEPLNNHCRYRLPSGEYFDYFPQSGKVISSGSN